ncbi:tubulin binding cofactor A [Clavulina sp. PMI_390]|nr:tubulin binding cofactor A [Clavulina sp. PMI_390]
MSTVATIKRQLKIKTGSVVRLSKDQKMYTTEAEELRVKIDTLVAENAEEWDVKNARKMLDESLRMIANSQGKLGSFVGELKDLVEEAEKEPELAGDSDLVAAQNALKNSEVPS